MAGALAALAFIAAPLAPAMAQVHTVDPDQAIDSDIGQPVQNTYPRNNELPAATSGTAMPAAQGNGTPMPQPSQYPAPASPAPTYPAQSAPGSPAGGAPMPAAPGQPDSGTTYHEDDLIGAAEGVFGTGAKGLADLIKDLLDKQGEPNAYIVGREAGAALRDWSALWFGHAAPQDRRHTAGLLDRPVDWL